MMTAFALLFLTHAALAETKQNGHRRERLLGPVRAGIPVGSGLPALLNFNATVRGWSYVGAGVNFGLIPKVKVTYYGKAELSYQEYDIYGRVYPFGNAFFVGTGIGYATIRGTLVDTVDLSPYQELVASLPAQVEYRSAASVRTLVLTPQIGFLHRFAPGFSVAMDLGLQVPLAASQVEFVSHVPTWIPTEAVDRYVGPIDEEVGGTLKRIGRTIIPTFHVRMGWLL